MFANRSRALFISAVLGALYSVYIIGYFMGAGNLTGASQAGVVIAKALVLPHVVLVVISTIVNFIAFFTSAKWFAVATVVLYLVAGVLFMTYFVFLLPMVVLSLIGILTVYRIKAKA